MKKLGILKEILYARTERTYERESAAKHSHPVSQAHTLIMQNRQPVEEERAMIEFAVSHDDSHFRGPRLFAKSCKWDFSIQRFTFRRLRENLGGFLLVEMQPWSVGDATGTLISQGRIAESPLHG